MLQQLINQESQVSNRPIRSAINSSAEAITYGAKAIGEVTKLGYYTIAVETANAKVEYLKAMINNQAELDALIKEIKA